MCSPGCFDYWSRLLALANARPDDARLSRRGFLAASAVPFVAAACAAAPAQSGPTLTSSTPRSPSISTPTRACSRARRTIRWPAIARARNLAA